MGEHEQLETVRSKMNPASVIQKTPTGLSPAESLQLRFSDNLLKKLLIGLRPTFSPVPELWEVERKYLAVAGAAGGSAATTKWGVKLVKT